MLIQKLKTLTGIVSSFENYLDYLSLLKGWTRKERVTLRTREGLRIICRNNHWDARIVAETLLEQVYMKHIVLDSHSAVVVDVGGYIGDFSLYAAKNLGARVIAYEPIPDNFELLEANIKVNDFGDRIKAWNKAVSGEPEIKINVARKDGDIHASGYMYAGSGEQIVIKCSSLAAVFAENNISNMDLLKVDCEGCEYGLLLGAPPETFEKIRNIVFEYHEIDGWQQNLHRLNHRLESLGYAVIQDPQLHIVSAVRR